MPFADAIEHHVRKAEDNLYREEQRLLEMFRNGSRDGEWIKKKASVDLFINQGIQTPFPKEVLIAITSLHQKGLIENVMV